MKETDLWEEVKKLNKDVEDVKKAVRQLTNAAVNVCSVKIRNTQKCRGDFMSKRIDKKSDYDYKTCKLRGQQEQARRTPYNFKIRKGGAKYEKKYPKSPVEAGGKS